MPAGAIAGALGIAPSVNFSELTRWRGRTRIRAGRNIANRGLTATQLIRLAEPLGLLPGNLKSHLTRMVNEGHIVSTLCTSVPGESVSFFPRLDRSGNLTGEAQAAWAARLRAGPPACASTRQPMTRRYRRKNSQ